MSSAEEWEDDSGPFCAHWSQPWDCEEACFTCGHDCRSHDAVDDSCGVGGCQCVAFVDECDVKPTTSNVASCYGAPKEEVRHPTLAEQVKALTARLESSERSVVKLRDQIIRATRERAALLRVVRARKPTTRREALNELKKKFPNWKGWA